MTLLQLLAIVTAIGVYLIPGRTVRIENVPVPVYVVNQK
jgi:hypothetical protein